MLIILWRISLNYQKQSWQHRVSHYQYVANSSPGVLIKLSCAVSAWPSAVGLYIAYLQLVRYDRCDRRWRQVLLDKRGESTLLVTSLCYGRADCLVFRQNKRGEFLTLRPWLAEAGAWFTRTSWPQWPCADKEVWGSSSGRRGVCHLAIRHGVAETAWRKIAASPPGTRWRERNEGVAPISLFHPCHCRTLNAHGEFIRVFSSMAHWIL